jgi:hypothetical protein
MAGNGGGGGAASDNIIIIDGGHREVGAKAYPTLLHRHIHHVQCCQFSEH